MNVRSIPQLEKKNLKRTLGVWDLFAIGYGDLGSSIYYVLGITTLFSLGATPISLALAGCVFLFTALTYAELSAMLPESGGVSTFARHAFNDSISFLAGWALLLDYIVTIAISAFAIFPYLRPFFHVFDPSLTHQLSLHLGFTVLIIAFLYCLNFFGIKHSTFLSFILTSITILTQLLIILIGLIFVFNLPDFIAHLRINGPDHLWSPSWSNFIQGTAMAMVAYTGIESIAQLSAEAKNPGKTIPKAIKLVIVVLLVSYFGISLVSLSAVSPQELGTTYLEDPIAGIAAHLPFGTSFLAPWVGLLAATLLLVASNAGLIGSSRLSFSMSEHYQLPRFLFLIHPRFRTPHITLAVFAIFAGLIVLASRGKMSFLANLYNFGAMIAFFSAHLSLIILRIKKPDAERPFKAPLNIRIKNYSIPLTAILGALATFGVWVLILFTKEEGRNLGLVWILFGGILYFIYRKKKKISPFAHLEIETIQIPEYAPISIKNILVPTRGGAYTENVQVACELARHHKAKITAIHVLEIPFALPIDGAFPERMAQAESVLKRADAIAREFDLSIQMKIIRSRRIDLAILDLLRKEPYDLIVIGASHGSNALGATVEKLLKETLVRVWICKNPAPTLK